MPAITNYLKAEYDDGTVITDLDYAKAWHDIQVAQHEGRKLVKFSFVTDQEHSIDFTKLPESARPIHYVIRSFTMNHATGERVDHPNRHFFGYQHRNTEGKSIKAIKEIT